MLTKEILNKFSNNANKWRTQFCVRMYTNNYFSKYQKQFNSEVKDWLYTDDDAIGNSCKYKNFWDTVIPSLQHWWILSIARLVDPPFFRQDINKKNLSIYYIIDLIENEELKLDIKNKLSLHKDFVKSIKELRNTFLAHNNIGEINNIIPAGIEDFFEELNSIILNIIEEYPYLKDCNDLNLIYTNKLSEAWVKELFEKII